MKIKTTFAVLVLGAISLSQAPSSAVAGGPGCANAANDLVAAQFAFEENPTQQNSQAVLDAEAKLMACLTKESE